MKVGQKIDHASFTKTHREFYSQQELVNAMRRNSKVWSWGAHAWTKMNDYCLRFMVNGHHHKGHVYLVVNGADLFDVYLTTNRGTIKEIMTDLFVEDLVERIDEKVERIPAYKH
jgi:Tfp pilus assembly protein PilV